jgi:hypothetical protein
MSAKIATIAKIERQMDRNRIIAMWRAGNSQGNLRQLFEANPKQIAAHWLSILEIRNLALQGEVLHGAVSGPS